jgi:hypothetical protein
LSSTAAQRKASLTPATSAPCAVAITHQHGEDPCLCTHKSQYHAGDHVCSHGEAWRIGDWITTYPSGFAFYPFDPRLEEISIEDIAHHLSNICRWTGATREFYSVAEHSVRMSKIAIDSTIQRWCLLHDAAEAYLNDMSTPVKRMLPDYKDAELRIELFIARKFDLPWPMPPLVKRFDMTLLATERRDLILRPTDKAVKPEELSIKAHETHITPLLPQYARKQFMTRYRNLWGLRGKEAAC